MSENTVDTKNPDTTDKDPYYKLADVPAMIKNPVVRYSYKLIQFPFEWITGISRMNRVHSLISSVADKPEDFTKEAQSYLLAEVKLPSDEELEPYRKIKGPIIMVSNHPLGGHEFLVMVPLFNAIRPEYKVLVNPFLLGIRELAPRFIPIDPYETAASRRKNMIEMKNIFYYLRKGGMIHLFPAGEVSTLKMSKFKIEDKVWNENIFQLAMKIKVTIIPLYFHGRVSNFFQFVGFFPRIRSLFLPRELTRKIRREVKYKLGKIITPEEIAKFKDASELTDYVRAETYKLREQIK